ncbi:MAG: hypothetical protein ABJE99_07020 [Roseobacter sp.]
MFQILVEYFKLHFFKISLLAGLLTASASTASTIVSQYDAFASISVSITSATFEHSGADALPALSNRHWDDGVDSGTATSGSGQLLRTRSGNPGVQGVSSYSASMSVSGHASPTETFSLSAIGDYILPTFYYGHSCSRSSTVNCADIDRVMLELSFEVETRVTTEVFDPLTGDASAHASAFLGFEYFLGQYQSSTADGWDFRVDASGNSLFSGSYSLALEADSSLGLMLYFPSVRGNASYTAHSAPSTVPLPPATPLLASGVLLLGLMSKRGGSARKKAAA